MPVDTCLYNSGFNYTPLANTGNLAGSLVTGYESAGIRQRLLGWSKTSNATTPDSSMLISGNTTLYAVYSTGYDTAVGKTGPGGGIVFSDKGDDFAANNGWRYMEVAPPLELQGAFGEGYQYSWSTVTDQSAGTEVAVGTGKLNTLKIIAQNDNAESAAKKATEYTLSIGGVTYNDWFLPSKDEMTASYTNTAEINKAILYNWDYWSSSEVSNTVAWLMWADQGADHSLASDRLKTGTKQIRPIRSFRSLKPTYTVLYLPNDGTGTTSDLKHYEAGDTFTVLPSSFTAPSGKSFNGWNTKADGTGTLYQPGSSTMPANNLVLYALW